MSKVLSVLVVGDTAVTSMFREQGFYAENFNMHQSTDLERFDKEEWNYDLYCFTGGEDVDPALYGENLLSGTYINPQRDYLEKLLFRKIPIETPKVGICRGGQLLNVLSGGRMWQHVDAHTRTHRLIDLTTKQEYRVTSTHHQMMRPSENGIVLAAAALSSFKLADGEKLSWPNWNRSLTEPIDPDCDDIEVVYYNNTNSLCFQPHPEYEINITETRRYFFQMLNKVFGQQLGTLAPIVTPALG